MTRINCSIPVESLNDKHLMAEHREIKRVCFRLDQRLKSNKFDDIPAPFSEIKKGEIVFKELFWLDKGKFTLTRYKKIHNECKRRGFKMSDFSDNWEIYKQKPEYFNDYTPTDEQNNMIQQRINDRNNKK
jgi:deoxyribonuclease (pyrimidine dimer)